MALTFDNIATVVVVLLAALYLGRQIFRKKNACRKCCDVKVSKRSA